MKIEDYEHHKIDVIMHHVFLNDSTDILPIIPLNSFYTHLGMKRWELRADFDGRKGIFGCLCYNNDRVVLSTIRGYIVDRGADAIIKFILKNVNLTTINGSKA